MSIEVSIRQPNGITIMGIDNHEIILHINDARILKIQLETAIRIFDDIKKA